MKKLFRGNKRETTLAFSGPEYTAHWSIESLFEPKTITKTDWNDIVAFDAAVVLCCA